MDRHIHPCSLIGCQRCEFSVLHSSQKLPVNDLNLPQVPDKMICRDSPQQSDACCQRWRCPCHPQRGTGRLPVTDFVLLQGPDEALHTDRHMAVVDTAAARRRQLATIHGHICSKQANGCLWSIRILCTSNGDLLS